MSKLMSNRESISGYYIVDTWGRTERRPLDLVQHEGKWFIDDGNRYPLQQEGEWLIDDDCRYPLQILISNRMPEENPSRGTFVPNDAKTITAVVICLRTEGSCFIADDGELERIGCLPSITIQIE